MQHFLLKKHDAVVLISLIGILWMFACNGAEKIVDRNGIRAAYWGIGTIDAGKEQLHRLHEHGFNAALVKDGNYVLREDLWHDWARQAKKEHLLFFSVINFKGRGESDHLADAFRRYVDRHGTEFARTPCPLDSAYWEASIGSRFRQLARLAAKAPLTGLLFDTEMYQSDFSVYTDVCLCNECWRHFAQIKELELGGIPSEKRGQYLNQHNLLSSYRDVQERYLHTILADIRAEIHSIAPELQLGFLAYRDNWFYCSLIKGLGTPKSPALVFSELTYVVGYTPYVDQELRSVYFSDSETEAGPRAQYVPGIWLGRFFPEDLASQVYALATHTHGYWIFTADSLWPNGQDTGAYALHGKTQDYWNALQRANLEIGKYHAASTAFQSMLPPVYLSSFYDTESKHLVIAPSLKDFMYTVLLDRIRKNQPFVPGKSTMEESVAPVTYRGKTLFHCLKNPLLNNWEGRIDITRIPLANYQDQTHYTVFDQNGEVVQEGSLDDQQSSVCITLSQEISGVLSILVDSGRNATQVAFLKLPYVVEASVTFPLSTIESSHAYIMPLADETSKLTLRAYCPAQETAVIAIMVPGRGIQQQQRIVEFTEMRVPVTYKASETPADFAIIRVSPVAEQLFEDVQWYLYNEEFPYVLVEDILSSYSGSGER